MTDSTPTSTALEDRLRATLAAEAARHRVTPDFERLRARADRTVVDLRLPPRRNRARIVAAAVVLAVLAAGAGIGIGQLGEADAPVTTDRSTPSGYYLPGAGWSVVDVSVGSMSTRVGTARYVTFLLAHATMARIDVQEIRTSTDALPFGWDGDDVEEVVRGTGADRHTLLVKSDTSTTEGPDGALGNIELVAQRPGQTLVLHTDTDRREVALDLAGRWVTSGGRDLSVDPAAGFQRWSDLTVPATEAIDLDGVCVGSCRFPPGTDEAEREQAVVDSVDPVHVRVTARDDRGTTVTYRLSPSGKAVRPTGVTSSDRGASRGLGPDERPMPSPGGPGDEIWAVAQWEEEPYQSALWSALPGADLVVQTPTEQTAPEVGLDAADAERALIRDLRPVDRDAWVAAVQGRGANPVPVDAWGETLAGTAEPAVDPAEGATTTAVAESTEPERVVTDDEAAATGQAVLDALRSLAPIGSPPSAPDRGAFAPEVTIGFVGDTDADEVLTGDRRFDTTSWELPWDGRGDRSGMASALQVASIGGITRRHPAPPDLACEGSTEPSRDDLFAYVLGAEDCEDWLGVLVRVDPEGRIAEVRVAVAAA